MHGDDHLGILVLCLPVPHEGGTFILSDDGNELKLPFDEMTENGETAWVAFYTDVKHQIEVVKSGTRITLQFDLYARKNNIEGKDIEEVVKINKYNVKSGNMYYFQDYNQEVLESFKNKLNKVFLQKEQLTINNYVEKFPGQNLLEEKKEFEEGFESRNQTKNKSRKIPVPDGIAIMLKRRYTAASLSLDKLKGSDNQGFTTFFLILATSG